MGGFLDNFRNKIISSVWKDASEPRVDNIDDKLALGVLLWVVAEADGKFMPEEEEKIKGILKAYSKLSDKDILIVLSSIHQAAEERVDLHRFTKEVSANLDYAMRVKIVEELFRVACVDKDLDNNELEVIRKIAGLFHLTHKDFIAAKIKIKKECGLDVVDV